jgi:hypothetical protein
MTVDVVENRVGPHKQRNPGERMATKKTLGQAIDDIVTALSELDEATRSTAVRAACEHLGLAGVFTAGSVTTNVEPSSALQPVLAPASNASVPPATARVQDIRSFKEQKMPNTAIEMACLVAYYLETLAAPDERKKDVNPTDLEKYFKQAGYRLPKRMPQLLVDGKAGGYFDSAGRGKYKLNPVGHNLVVHGLPKAKST